MSLIKVKGIIIKQINLGESDKIITIFTDKLGKIQAVARGAKKPKSKLMASTQVFTLGEFVLYKGKNLYSINQAEIIESFQAHIKDLNTLAYCSYLLEIIDAETQFEEPNCELLLLAINIFYIIIKNIADIDKIIHLFEIKSICMCGYMPNLDSCSLCNEKNFTPIFFNIKNGGIICEKCAKIEYESIKIDLSTVNTIKYLIQSKLINICNLKLSSFTNSEIQKIMKGYLKYYLGRDFKSLEYLK